MHFVYALFTSLWYFVEKGEDMFGYVMASIKELSEAAKKRYSAVYCGICRAIRDRSGQLARLSLSYDMAFLALLLMSLYEPEERCGTRACGLHPIKPRPWTDNEYVRYAADMNIFLAYLKALDDKKDEGKFLSGAAAKVLEKNCVDIRERYPRQCRAAQSCIEELSRLEMQKCDNPDLPAACFGQLMGELFALHEDMWAPYLRQMGMALGRYIYLADAAMDYRRDKKKKQYNPFLAMGMQEDWQRWEQYLVMAMGRCTEHYERLPLVQDKDILDNILYSGVWVEYRRKQRALKVPQEEANDR